MDFFTMPLDSANAFPHGMSLPVTVASRCQPASGVAPSLPAGPKEGSLSNKTPPKRKRRPKAADAPRRPLSAYNLFFKQERAAIVNANTPSPSTAGSPPELVVPKASMERPKKKRVHRKTHGKIGFADLARQISEKWKSLDAATKSPFEKAADIERKKYREEVKKYNEKKASEKATMPVAVDAICRPAKKVKTGTPAAVKDCLNTAAATKPLSLQVTSAKTESQAGNPNDALLDIIDDSIWEDTSCTKTLIDVLDVASEVPFPDQLLGPDTATCISTDNGPTQDDGAKFDIDVQELLRKLEAESPPADDKPINASQFNEPKLMPAMPLHVPSSLIGNSFAQKYPMSNKELFNLMMMPYMNRTA